ncbi:MAG: metal-dependent hydrolase, partial [Tepidanaerobacteraceae bacterium]
IYTMGIEDAAKAVEMIKPKKVIPMHYNTFPAIQRDPMEFKKLVEARTQTEVIILKPGESVEI